MTQSPDAQRVARYRSRKKNGTVVVTLEIEADAVGALVRLGWLDANRQCDPTEVRDGLIGICGAALQAKLKSGCHA